MNGPGFGPTIDLWGLASLVTLARATIGLGVVATAAWLIYHRRWPDRR